MKKLCIYHGNCADGFAAAWVVRHALGDDVEFHAGVYQDEPPNVRGRHVIVVDFSYKKPQLEVMRGYARSLLILDHHKSAAEDLCDLPSAGESYARFKERATHTAALFDMERSGAGIAWDFFMPGRLRPQLINHIEDRDLWRFRLDGTREIQAALFSYPYDFEAWDALMALVNLDRLRVEGAAIERKHHKDIAELVGVVTRMMKICGFTVPVANLPYTLTSDAGHLLCGDVPAPPGTGSPSVSRYPFAGCYWDTPAGRVFSLRSREDGFDVSAIAKQYGGGGHAHAAGFRVPFDQLGQFDAA